MLNTLFAYGMPEGYAYMKRLWWIALDLNGKITREYRDEFIY